ncbi:MAG: hypothetical protein ACR2KX_16610 [Chitinophagaceae bacterium]
MNNSLKTITILFLLPLKLFAQDLTGLWTGFLQTKGFKYPYELVISKNGEELTGYSLTVFTINNVENIGVKSIIFKNKNGNIFIEDKELVFNNYTTPPKRVKQYNYLVLKAEDSIVTLIGTFRTRSWESLSYTGTIQLQKRDISTPSKLISKLDEINLLNSLSFMQTQIKQKKDVAVVSTPSEKLRTSSPKENEKEIVSASGIKESAPPILQEKSKDKDISVIPTPVIIQNIPAPSQPQLIDVVIDPSPSIKKPQTSAPAKEEEKPAVIVSKPITDNKEHVVSAPKPYIAVAAPPPVKQMPEPVSNIGAAQLAKRKIETIRSVFVKSDSLVLSLFDNGEVDGDTVSVLLNGKVIISKQGLNTNAIKKTIYFTPDLGDSLQVIMYAENLGKIPPNTGLLILQGGDDRYEIRFAGDLQKNSAITLKRKDKTL